MESKYNVDDILSEIKNRKIREKSMENTPSGTSSPTVPRAEPRRETRPEPRYESKPEPRREPRPEPRYEPKPEPRREPRPEPKPEPEAGPAMRSQFRPESFLPQGDPRKKDFARVRREESEFDAGAFDLADDDKKSGGIFSNLKKPKLKHELEPERDVRPEPKYEPKPEPRRETRPEPKYEPKAELRRETKPELKYEPKAEPRRETKPEPKYEPKAEPRREAKPELRYEPKPEADPTMRSQFRPESFLPPGDPRKKDFARARREEFEFEAGAFDLADDEDTGSVAADLKKPKPKSNPLEFSGEARSITEKAKLRGTERGVKSPLKKFEFNPKAPRDIFGDDVSAAGQISITGEFDAAVETFEAKKPVKFGAKNDKTRVLPSLSAVREMKTDTGEVKKADFGKFALNPEAGAYYDDEVQDDGVQEGSVIDYSEYNSTSDRRDVQTDIARVKLWLFIRVSLTLVLTAVLFVLTLAAKYSVIPLPEFMWPEIESTLRMYLIICTSVTIAVALVNSAAVGGGLMGLFKMHANSDSLSACAIVAAIGQGFVVIANPDACDPAGLSLYFCAAALAMLFNTLGKMTMINRILSNFRIIASDQPKKAVVAVDSDEFCHEFIKDSTRRPTMVYSVSAGFFSDFLGISYSDKYDVGVNRATAPVCLLGSLLVGFVTYFLSGSIFFAVSAITAILCVSATFSSTFIENVPLSKLAKRLTPRGGMVSGSKTVEDFCDTRAVILTENDLFPQGNVQLHGIKAFPNMRVDEAIIDAASVLCAMDGALGPVFLEMIGGNKKLLKKADNIVFENSMGISAWVDSRRVLIGNRKLMLNHGITLPREIMEQKQWNPDSEPLFLSNSGEASAMFTVGYHIDDELAAELDALATHDIQLIVHTTDANITANKICELYGYPLEMIRVLPAEWHQQYKEMTEPRDREVAEIVYTGKAPTMVSALLSCMAARGSILSATIIQLVQIVLGYALVTFMAFMGSIGSLNILNICAYQLFWFVAIYIVQKVRQS